MREQDQAKVQEVKLPAHARRDLANLSAFRNDGLDIRNVHFYIEGDSLWSPTQTLTAYLRSVDAENRKYDQQCEVYLRSVGADRIVSFGEENPVLRFNRKAPAGWTRIVNARNLYRPTKNPRGKLEIEKFRSAIKAENTPPKKLCAEIANRLMMQGFDLSKPFLQHWQPYYANLNVLADFRGVVLTLPVLDLNPHYLRVYREAVAAGMERYENTIHNAARVQELHDRGFDCASGYPVESWWVADQVREAEVVAERRLKERERSASRRKSSSK